MIFRSPKLLKLARDCKCMNPDCPNHVFGGDGTTVAAHSNQLVHGKGMGIKAHDCFIAFLCQKCHFDIDQGSSMGRQEKEDLWQRAHDETMLYLFNNGHLKVV